MICISLRRKKGERRKVPCFGSGGASEGGKKKKNEEKKKRAVAYDVMD